jgi:hypothetical protein
MNRFLLQAAALVCAAGLLAVVGCGDPAGGGGGDTVITILSLDSFITTPVKNAQPITMGIDTDQYTGTVAWQITNSTPHSGPFAPSTIYQAVLTLTAKTGWTFTGMGSFTYTGAQVVDSNNTGAGITITITFPATAGAGDPDPNANAPITIGNPSVALYLDGGTTSLTHNGSTPISSGTGVFTVGIALGSYTEITWYVNGSLISHAQDQTSISFSKARTGTYMVTVGAVPAGGEKNSGAHTFVVE